MYKCQAFLFWLCCFDFYQLFLLKIHCKWNREGEKWHKKINFAIYRDVSDSLSFFFFFSPGDCYYFASHCGYYDVFNFGFKSRKPAVLQEQGLNCRTQAALASWAGRRQGGPRRRTWLDSLALQTAAGKTWCCLLQKGSHRTMPLPWQVPKLPSGLLYNPPTVDSPISTLHSGFPCWTFPWQSRFSSRCVGLIQSGFPVPHMEEVFVGAWRRGG